MKTFNVFYFDVNEYEPKVSTHRAYTAAEALADFYDSIDDPDDEAIIAGVYEGELLNLYNEELDSQANKVLQGRLQ